MDVLKYLDHPPREYTPVPFWFLNGNLTHGEIRRQMRDFCDHGVYGVVLHPRMGLSKRIGYLSKAFFSYLRTAVETARELDMKIVLYDEGMYPSGSAGGLVVKDRPDLASRGIGLQEKAEAGDHVLCKTEKGYLVERFSGGTIRGVHFGEDDGEPFAPKSADILNPEAVERFVNLTHDAYWRELGEYFGDPILGFFTDEPSILGRNTKDLFPWTKNFDRVFLSAGGRLENLAALFSGEENEDTRLYHRLILEREGKTYYARLSRWCEEHGVSLMGHPHQSDDIEVERYFHVPGQDLVFRWVAPEKGGTAGMDSTMAKCGADMARLMGRKRNSNECFGACNRENNPWHFTGSDMKWYIDWLGVRGVNLFIPHAFYYSLKGKRSGERPPDVGPGSIWWPHYRLWAEYMARVSCLMAEGRIAPRVGVLCRNRDLAAEKTAALYETQRSFQYLPASFFPECREDGGKLRCGNMEFDVIMGEKALFPSVSRDISSASPDLICQPPQRELRVARLVDDTRQYWYCVNEGMESIQGRLILPADGLIGKYDLWTGKRFRVESEAVREGRSLPYILKKNESALYFTCDEDMWNALSAETADPPVTLTNEDFSLFSQDEKQHQRTYAASVDSGDQDIRVFVEAEEMAELYANGQLLGVSFWPPQVFTVPKEMMKKGPVTLRLVVTGSLANRYGKPVPYGLK